MSDSRDQFRPLRWQYLKRSSAFLWGLPFLTLFGTACVAFAIGLSFKHREFQADGVQTMAIVVHKESKQVSHGSRGSQSQRMRTTRYYLDTEYEDPATKSHQSRVQVPRTVYQRTRVGEGVAIEYLRGNPARARIVERTVSISRGGQDHWVFRRESVDEAEGSVVLGILALLFFSGAGVIGTLTMRSAGRRAQLILTGVTVMGRVREVVKSDWNNGGRQYVVVYEFQDAEGRHHTGRSPRFSEQEQSRWQSGQDIRIVHDRHDPARHEIDLFDIRARDPGLRV